MNDTAKIMLRVKKMMALANDAGATESEREAALAHATALLQKHNLSMRDMPEEEDDKRMETDMTVCCDTWARSLCQGIAGLFFCNYYFMRTRVSGKEKHCFVGREGNAVTAMEMSNFLIKSIRKEAAKRYGSATSPEGRSFGVGAVAVLRKRIAEMKQGAKPDVVGTGNALVLADLYKREELANDAFLKAQGVEIVTKAARRSSLVGDAYQSGRAHGQTISLNSQVGGSRTSSKMIGR